MACIACELETVHECPEDYDDDGTIREQEERTEYLVQNFEKSSE